jgi:hypothetical protein
VTDEQRSRETRARAETALVRLLHELRDDEPFLENRDIFPANRPVSRTTSRAHDRTMTASVPPVSRTWAIECGSGC